MSAWVGALQGRREAGNFIVGQSVHSAIGKQ